MDLDSSTYLFKSCIRGYHEYKEIWDAAIGEVLDCEVGVLTCVLLRAKQ